MNGRLFSTALIVPSLVIFFCSLPVVQMDAWWQMGRMIGKFFEL